MRRPLRALLLPLLLVSSALGAQGTSPAAAAPRDLPLRPSERAIYVGRYSLTDGARGGATPLRVFESNGTLMGQMRGNTPSRLLHQGSHAFRPADAVEFELQFAVSGGHATGVTMRGPGVVMRGTRDADASGEATADSSQRGALYDELARVDSVLFDAAYVRCDTARVYALLSDDIEFYHDVTGVHRGAQVRADFARLAASCPRAQGVRREVVPGSLHVYPVSGFGAVQTGVHRFVRQGEATATTARFVHVWQRNGGEWKATRILSLDHHATDLP